VSIASYRTAVSLHGHTLHSRESLDFLYRLAPRWRAIRFAMRRIEKQFREAQGRQLNFANAWWTPPLAPHDAWRLERDQIAGLGYQPLVSLTDHDDIDAPLNLQVLEECRGVPVSVEWTLPYQGTCLHLGVHNLPAESARAAMLRLADYTRNPAPEGPGAILAVISATPGTLVVLNHPLWDELGVGEEVHRHAAIDALRRFRRSFHAIEWNGLRPWSENRQAAELAREFVMPVVSGGDRHGLEPNTVLNLTDASTFAEFAEEVRAGFSHVLITDRYADAHALRMLQTVGDVLRDHPGHGRGWVRWSDRIFYRCDHGEVRSLSELCGDRVPRFVRGLADTFRLAAHRPVRQAFRLAFARRQAVVQL